jgi:adenine-specific DNA-methyltransferase
MTTERSKVAEALSQVRTIENLSCLFQTLGYQPDKHPFDSHASVIAHWRGFEVVATESSQPRDSARDLARKLAHTTARALAVAINPTSELAVAAPRLGQPGTTKILLVTLDHPSAFAVQQLERLTTEGSSSALGHALRVADVLSSEEVSERFFTAFRVILERMAASIGDRGSPSDRRMITLLALTRILFLYFVQAKGWLDGRTDFLSQLLDDALASGRNFHRTSLQPLFFGTLNRPIDRRRDRDSFGSIPYLNGGLFEPHAVERRVGSVHFANDLWRDAFDCVFERFRFCINEADEVDAVAPDMLGRAFERLMDVAERHDSGTFYTPESVVHQVVEATIEVALSRDLPPDTVRSIIERQPLPRCAARDARRVLRRLRILDPAVGSGAFLLGALQSLTDMRLSLNTRADGRVRSRLKREILRENLMGVDLNPVAVRLAELRLWLAVIADDSTNDISAVTPLPNLDGVVRQGDTLFDPLSTARALDAAFSYSSGRVMQSVRTARRALFESRGRAQQESLGYLRESETRMAETLLLQAMKSIGLATADLTSAALSKDLFGKRAGLTDSQRVRRRVLREIRKELQRARARLSDEELPFFAFEVHAPEIMAAGGFDIVVGNPPWVRAERLAPTRRRALRERFTWWRCDGDRGFAHLPDLSVAFLQRCLELAAPGGAVGLLLPSKLTSAKYGETARRTLVKETSIAYLHRVADQDAARFKATTYPFAVVVRKERPDDGHVVHLDFGKSSAVPQSALDVPGSWTLLPLRVRAALDEFRSSGESLGTLAPPVLGLKTGANDVFVGRLLESYGETVAVELGSRRVILEESLVRPALRGRDIRAFRACSNRILIWTHDDAGKPLHSLPRKASRYFEQQSTLLRSRKDYRAGPPWTVFRVTGAISEHRVVWSDIAQSPRAVALDETEARSAIPLNSCYLAPVTDAKVALVTAATMNSTWARALATACADEARGGYRRINSRVAAQIPIPAAGPKRDRLAEFSRLMHNQTDADNNDVDEMVADALDLSSKTRTALRTLAANHS